MGNKELRSSFSGTSIYPFTQSFYVTAYVSCFRNKVAYVVYSPTGRKLVSGGEDSMIWIWNMKAPRKEVWKVIKFPSCFRIQTSFRLKSGPSPAYANVATGLSSGIWKECLIRSRSAFASTIAVAAGAPCAPTAHLTNRCYQRTASSMKFASA